MEDLSSKKFDMLTVIKYAGKTKYRVNIWTCRCECGKEKDVLESTLKNTEHFHSCGCYYKQFLTAGDSNRCSKAGKARATARNVDGINIDMLDNNKNIITNTSGHKGVSWSKTARKWHVFVGYKGYRCTLAFVEDMKDAVCIREEAVKRIKEGTFEDFFYDLRGFRIEEKLKRQMKKENSNDGKN